MDWRIYYGDGSTLASDEADVQDVPPRGVQAIVQPHPDVAWEIVSHADYYVWEGRWRGVDLFGLYDYLLEPGWKRALFGRTLSQPEFTAIFNRANEDKEFGVKHGFLPCEARP